nr:MAG TPA: hypothetical protein [Caudoviricetes sp.]
MSCRVVGHELVAQVLPLESVYCGTRLDDCPTGCRGRRKCRILHRELKRPAFFQVVVVVVNLYPASRRHAYFLKFV